MIISLIILGVVFATLMAVFTTPLEMLRGESTFNGLNKEK